MSKIFTMPVVRRRGRGGREILRFAAARFQNRKSPEEHRRWPRRQGRHRAGGGLHAGRPALHGAQWRHAIRIQPMRSSFKIDCADQAEVDRLWDALSANGGSVERCGWLKDRFGVSWQIVPTALVQYLGGPDSAGARRAMQAMMQMVKLDIAGLKKAPMRASQPPDPGGLNDNGGCNRYGHPRLERDDFSSNRHPALALLV